jgi:hypothetical protein
MEVGFLIGSSIWIRVFENGLRLTCPVQLGPLKGLSHPSAASATWAT